MRDLKISVIIPVYNTEKYIKKCIESVINQTYKNLEIIIINDGTEDNAIEIVKEYLVDKRIRIINKANGGASSARNIGIRVALGDYISFVDSDDYLELELYEKILKNLCDEDILIFNFRQVDSNTEKVVNNRMIRCDKLNKIKKGYMYHYISDYSSCNKIYKKEFLKKNSLNFCEGIIHEDRLWSVECFGLTDNIKYLDINGYIYRVNREGSVVFLYNNDRSEEQKMKDKISFRKSIEKLERIIKYELSIEKKLKIQLEIERDRYFKDNYIDFYNINKKLKLYFKDKNYNMIHRKLLRDEIRELLSNKNIKNIKNISLFDVKLWKYKIYTYKVFRRILIKKIKNWRYI